MTLICEDSSTYNPDIDPVAKIVLSVGCHPAQVNAIVDFIAGIEHKAGVYYAAFDVFYAAPVESVAAVEEVLTVTEEVPVPVAEPEGDEHGEQPLQLADSDDQGSLVGEGSSPAEGIPPEVGTADEDGGLSGTAGESPIEGPLKRDLGGEDLRLGAGLARGS